MKTFLEQLEETTKTYSYRIKIANINPADNMDRLEAVLDAYGLENISKPKSLPVSENQIDFPSMGAVEVWVIDVDLKYPVNDAQLRAIVSERWNVPPSQLVVVPRSHPEELWRNEEGELRTTVPGESVLLQDYEDNDKTAGDVYQSAEVAGKDVKDKPPVEAEDGTLSPVGSTQNTIKDTK